MAAATKDRRDTDYRHIYEIYEYGQATATTIYAGTIVFLNSSGYAEPATSAASKISAGVAMEQSVNAGANGAVKVRVAKGVFKLLPQSGDAPTIAHIGDDVYADDDQTVGLSVEDPARSVVGKVVDIDTDGGVFVRIF